MPLRNSWSVCAWLTHCWSCNGGRETQRDAERRRETQRDTASGGRGGHSVCQRPSIAISCEVRRQQRVHMNMVHECPCTASLSLSVSLSLSLYASYGLHTPPSGASFSGTICTAVGPLPFCRPRSTLVNPRGAAGGVSVLDTKVALVLRTTQFIQTFKKMTSHRAQATLNHAKFRCGLLLHAQVVEYRESC